MDFTKILKRLYNLFHASSRNRSDLSLSYDIDRGRDRIGDLSGHRLAVGC